jgi:5-formyltetrahydrofolate cyclo-ligase
VADRSEIIAQKLDSLACMKDAASIMCYVSFGNEVYTHSLIKKWICEGRQISVPSVANAVNGSRSMYAVKLTDFSELSAKGKYGILEPPLLDSNIIDPSDIDIIIVPGSAFDINKNRMGYGAGFYDTFFASVPAESCKKVGICFDFQVFNLIPYDEHDIPLDLLVTDKRIII